MMSEWLKKGWAVLLAATLLVGCGGSGTSDSTDDGGTTGPTAATIELTTDAISLASSGTETALVRALVKDASNVVIPGATVSFSSDSGSITVTQPTTDAAGLALANLTTGGDRSNRNITVTATVSGSSLTDTLVIPVTGSSLAFTAPSSVTAGSSADLTLVLRDSDNNGIPNQQVTLASSLGNGLSPASPLTTGVNGSVTVTYTATNAGTDTLSASALGGTVTASQSVTVSGTTISYTLAVAPAGDIQLDDAATAGALEGVAAITLTWLDNGTPQANKSITFSTTRGKFDVDGSGTATGADTSVQTLTTNASGQAVVSLYASNAGTAVVTAAAAGGPSGQTSISFVSVVPSSITSSASPASVGPNGQQSTITAIVRDAAGNLVKNARVIFSLEDVSGGQISPGFADTNASGVASTVYTSNSASATNGVKITSTVSCDANLDGSIANGETCSSLVSITVANTSLFISIGTGNSVRQPNDVQYVKDFTVFITDSNGNARPNQAFQVSVVPWPDDGSEFTGTGDDVDDPAATDGRYNKSGYFKGFYTWDTLAGAWEQTITESCRNEDVDLDGTLDSGEDTNNDDVLTPGSGVAVDASSATQTDTSGFATVSLRYPQENAYWLQVRISVKASVNGTESVTTKRYTLDGISTDYNQQDVTPPGQPSPFGFSQTCSDAD